MNLSIKPLHVNNTGRELAGMPSWAKYVARDSDGSTWAYKVMPILDENLGFFFVPYPHECQELEHFTMTCTENTILEIIEVPETPDEE